MAEIKTRPATPEFRDGWDRIFRKKTLSVDEWREQYQQQPIAEIDRLMAQLQVGAKVVVRGVSGGELGCIVTADADYNRKLFNALFKVSRHDFGARGTRTWVGPGND